MAAQDFLAALPPPLVDDTTLGLPPLPEAPAMPAPMELGATRSDKLQAVASLIGAMIAGPRRGGLGMLAGTSQSLQQNQQQRRLEARDAQQLYEQQQQNYMLQQRQYQAEADRRRATVENTVSSLRELAPTLATKADYDRYVQAYGQALRSQGYRLDENFLRSAVPYMAPKMDAKAQELLNRWLAIETNKTLFEQAPERALDSILKFDRDGDGIPEQVTIRELGQMAGVFAIDPDTGQVVTSPVAGSAAKMSADAESVYQALRAKAIAEGKAITPDLERDLRLQAIRDVDTAKPPDPTLDAIRQLQLQQLREGGGLSVSQKFTREEQLAAKWQKANSANLEMRRQFDLMRTGLRRFRSGDKNGGSQAVLVTFQKILDPTSVVREAEYARTAAGQSLLNRIQGFEQRIIEGGAGMTESELAAMVETARQFLEQMEGYNASERRRIETQIGQYGLNSEAIFTDVPEAPEPDAAPLAPAGGQSPAGAAGANQLRGR